MSLKNYLKVNRAHSITSAPEPMGEQAPQAEAVDHNPSGAIEINPSGAGDAVIPGLSGNIPAENPDPLKQRIHAHPHRRGLVYRLLAPKTLSPDEKAQKEEQVKRRELEKVLRKEAELYKSRIITALNTRNLCYRYPRSKRDLFVSGVQSVSFADCVMQPDAIYFRVDTCHMPRGVGVLQLVDPDILTDLSLACGRRVLAEYNEAVGAWYIIERATGARGIPNHVKLQDMIERFPTTADPLTIPLGVTVNGKLIYRSIRNMPHLLLAGTTGGGKSNQLNVILVTLLSRNKPADLKLLLIDLKGGLELSHYAGIPHLITIEAENKAGEKEVISKGIIKQPQDIPPALAWVIQEAERRMNIISHAGYSDIVDYNARRAKKLPRILICVDELASIRLLDPKAGKESERMLTDLGNRGRAVGIHIILCTQYPDKAVLSTAIKAILNTKMAFACSTYPASMIILGNGDAKGLSPVGRYIYQSGAENLPIQAPFFPKQFRDELIENIREGKGNLSLGRSHDVTELEIMEWALQNNQGVLSFSRLYEIYKSRGIKQAELEEWLKSWEGNKFRVLEGYYEVVPGAGRKPRMMKPIEA